VQPQVELGPGDHRARQRHRGAPRAQHRLFFFSSRRRHTRFSRDWSSDVCSSDLELALKQISEINREVAMAAEEHSKASATITRQIGEIHELCGRTSRHIQENNSLVTSLSQTFGGLRQMLTQF